MSWSTLRPQLKTILDNSDLFVDVSGFPKLKFNGYPAAYVAHDVEEASYDTTSENERVYAFKFYLSINFIY